MSRNTPLDNFTRFAGSLTRLFPDRGGKFLDGVLYPLIGNDFWIKTLGRHHQKKLKGIRKMDRILVISDIHIGDSVLFQTAISALKDFFPEIPIDYVVKRSMKDLLEGNPDISDLWPIFTGGEFPSDRDILAVQAMSEEYDAVFNFCPFFLPSAFPPRAKVFHFTTHSPVFVKNERDPGVPNHITYQAHRFIHDLLSPSFNIQRPRLFEGPGVFLTQEAIQKAWDFLENYRLLAGEKLVFMNPDTASPYTRVPFAYQARLLHGLVEMPCRTLLGEGHTEKGTGEKLLLTLPLWKREKVTLVPATLPLDTYTALIDHSDVFISGDTGPLHLAAAWKRDRQGNHVFRNRTAILSIFGATPPRFSGYDSAQPGYLESEQRAESHSYRSASACRNLTCMHKMAKNCDANGCFQSLDVEQILRHTRNLLEKTGLSSIG